MNDDPLIALYDFIRDHFSLEELEVLCFGTVGHDMMQNWKGAGHTRDKIGMELIGYCKRYGVTDNLLANVQKARPAPYAEKFPPMVISKPSKKARDPKQVFISHSSKDAEIAHRLADDLRRIGLRVWITPGSILPLEAWEDAIERGLDESGRFVLLASPNAAQSDWVKRETREAYRAEQQNYMRLYPLMIEDCDLSDIYRWLDKQAIHCHIERYNDGLRELLTAMGIVDHEAEARLLKAEVGKLKTQLSHAQDERDEARQKLKRTAAELDEANRTRDQLRTDLQTAQTQIAQLDAELKAKLSELATLTDEKRALQRERDAALAKLSAPPVPLSVKPSNKDRHILKLAKDVGIEFIRIPAGEFLYGEDKHKLNLPEYWLGKTVVTTAQYLAFVKATGHKAHDYWNGNLADKLKHPAVYVNWDDAQVFCAWASKLSGQKVSLPTEQQWEKGARGTDGCEYPWGDESPNAMRANYDKGWEIEKLAPVGSYSPVGDSPYGLQDMAGNVWEWCADWYDDGKTYRALRGGGFNGYEDDVRVSDRSGGYPDGRVSTFGFRLVYGVFPMMNR
ncbi:MAG: SUMF1/EgtB/PvdO family nonheme iron enzyme [Anaerolineae bacterium]|nr:SUMF1/EgtB/PvdO family nonheme iron enzyme [Anaerolineae bacterium]